MVLIVGDNQLLSASQNRGVNNSEKRSTDFEIFNKFQDFTITKLQSPIKTRRNPTKAGVTCEMVYILKHREKQISQCMNIIVNI